MGPPAAAVNSCFLATANYSGLGGLKQQQPKFHRLGPCWFYTTVLVRGGADATVVAVGDKSTAVHETFNRRSDDDREGLEETVVLGLDVEPSAESEDADKRSKGWLLNATEHDR